MLKLTLFLFIELNFLLYKFKLNRLILINLIFKKLKNLKQNYYF